MLGVEIDGQFHTVAFSNGHTFDASAQTAEIITKDHPANCADYEVTGFSWSLTTDNLVEDSKTAVKCGYNVMMKAAKEMKPINVRLAYFEEANTMDAVTGTNNMDWHEIADPVVVVSGQAIITNLELHAPNKQNATYKATLSGKGPFVVE